MKHSRIKQVYRNNLFQRDRNGSMLQKMDVLTTIDSYGQQVNRTREDSYQYMARNLPLSNMAKDGYIGIVLLKTYDPNNYGLYQMIGNVWESCLNLGQIELSEFQNKSSLDFLKENYMPSDDYYTFRGGSFLYHYSYCQRIALPVEIETLEILQ